eukprot:SAG31_NODE_1314_length_8851_cov_7.233318_1_plen_276_part_10
MDLLFAQLESNQKDRSGELVAALLGENNEPSEVAGSHLMDSVPEGHEGDAEVVDADSESSANIHGQPTLRLSDSAAQSAQLYDEPEEPTQTEVDAKKLQIQQVCAMVVMVGVVTGFVFWKSIAWTVLAGVCAVNSFILSGGKTQMIFQHGSFSEPSFVQVSVLEVVLLGGEGASVLRHTDGFLLVMICGLFVVIAGARATKVPDTLYDNFSNLSPAIHKEIDGFFDLLAYSLLIMVFSNICSNVPTVMLLSHTLRQDGKPTANGIVAWLMLSLTST